MRRRPSSQLKIIITSLSENYVHWFIGWYASLIELGKYSGEVAVINCGIKQDTIKRLKRIGIIIIPGITKHGDILIDRFISLENHLSQLKDYLVIHWDSDIWFQDDINQIFDIIRDKICFTIDVEWWHHPVMLKESHPLYTQSKDKLQKIHKQHGGNINGGFIGGPALLLSDRLRSFDNLITEQNFDVITWRNTPKFYTDQLVLNLLFNNETDKIISRTWNGIGPPHGKYLSINKDIHFGNGERCKVIHLMSPLRRNKDLFFENRYGGFYQKYKMIISP